jgi:hypothetical protein
MCGEGASAMEKERYLGSLSKGWGSGIEDVVRGCILWGYQALHVRDGVTGSRFLRRNKWGKRELCSPAPYERPWLRRVGVGGGVAGRRRRRCS